MAASLARRLSMWAARDSNLLSYARNELNDPSTIDDGAEMEAAINSAILGVLAAHSNAHHSGSTHGYAFARANGGCWTSISRLAR